MHEWFLVQETFISFTMAILQDQVCVLSGKYDENNDQQEAALFESGEQLGRKLPSSSHRVFTVKQKCSTGCILRWGCEWC